MKRILINKKEDLADLMKKFETIEENFRELPDGMYEITIQKPRRTPKQNRALHVFLQFLVEALNEAGLYMNKEFFKEGYEAEWNPTTAKELIWRPMQKAITKKESSKELTTKELTQVADAIQKAFANKGVSITFPSMEGLMNNEIPYEVFTS